MSKLSGTGDSQRDSRELIRANRVAIETPIFTVRQADSPESLEFPIRANHAIKCPRYHQTSLAIIRPHTKYKTPSEPQHTPRNAPLRVEDPHPTGRVSGPKNPKGPKIEKFQSRLKFSIPLEKFQSRLKFSIRTFRSPHKNRGLVGGSLEIFNLA